LKKNYFDDKDVKTGAEFLKNIFPKELLDNILPDQREKKLRSLKSLELAFLSALDSGSRGLAFICKSKILEEAKELLGKCKSHGQDGKELSPVLHKVQKMIEQEEKTALTEEKLKKIVQKIGEWDLEVKLEEKYSSLDRLQFEADISSNALPVIKLLVDFFPNELALQLLTIASTGISWMGAGLTVIVSGLALKKTTAESEDFHKWTNMSKQDSFLLDTAKNLLQKRQAVRQNKVSFIKSHFDEFKHKIQKFKAERMGDSNAMDNFEHSVQTESKEAKTKLIESYVDHQETIEQTTKNALKQMVQQKHAIEGEFLNLELNKSRVVFSLSAISLAVTIGLAVAGLLSVPLGGASFILLALSVGSVMASFTFFLAKEELSLENRYYATKALTVSFRIKMAYAALRRSIHTYFHQAKEKKLLETAEILEKYVSISGAQKKNDPDYQQAFARFKNAKLDVEKSKKNVALWSKKLKNLELHLMRQKWKDFAREASLQISSQPTAFDTLKAFREALHACDLRLLSPEMRTLLERELAFDLKHLQEEIDNDSTRIKNHLQEFFTLEDAALVAFMRKQKALLESVTVQSPPSSGVPVYFRDPLSERGGLYPNNHLLRV